MAYGRVNVGGESGVKIKSMQIVEGTFENFEQETNITISQVDSTNSILKITASSNDFLSSQILVKFNSNTSIKIKRGSYGKQPANYRIQVIEFEGLKSLQYLEGKLLSNESKTINLTKTVNINKSFIISSKMTNLTGITALSGLSILEKLNSNNIVITSQSNETKSDTLIGIFVIEFK